MISLGKFLAHKRDGAVGPLKFLLLAISSTAIKTGISEREAFQRQVESAAERVSPETDALESEIATIADALARYNTAAEQRAAAQQQELRAMIAVGLDTVAAIGASSETGVQNLRALESKLESASAVEDLRALKGKLLACLTLVRNETVRLQMDSRRLVQSLKASALRASAELKPGTDGTTGLPGPAALHKALLADSQVTGERHIAVFVVDDLMTMNVLHGRAAGDELLRVAGEHLIQGFGASGKIHRWNGPAFVIAAPTNVSAEDFREKARSLSLSALSVPIGSDGETKDLSASMSWMIETLSSGQLTEAASRNLDAFVSKHIGAPSN